jgi:hypothetical protein
MSFDHRVILLGALATLATPRVARAQAQPFLFVEAPGAVTHPRSTLQLDAAVGDRPFEAMDGAGAGDALQGLRGTFWLSSRLTLLVRSATTSAQHDRRWASQGELRWRAMGSGGAGTSLAFGVGARREFAGSNVLLGSVSAAHTAGRSVAAAALSFEHPMASAALNRDVVDVMTAVGWSLRVSDVARVGLEALGEDLEGFWDPAEAEGGATLFVGPSTTLSPRTSRFSLVLAGGWLARGSRSERSSGAARELVAGTHNGYTMRAALRFELGQ